MPSLEVVWVIIGFVPALVGGDKPPIPVTMGSGAVFASAETCEVEAGYRRDAWPAVDGVVIRCMPYWINWKGARR